MRIGEHPEPTGSASRRRLERSLAIGGFLVGLALGNLLGGLAPSGSSDPVRMSAAGSTGSASIWSLIRRA